MSATERLMKRDCPTDTPPKTHQTEHKNWTDIMAVLVTGWIAICTLWVIIAAFRWLKHRSWTAILSRTGSGIQLASEGGEITLSHDSDRKFMNIENPLQGFIHNKVERDQETDNYKVGEVKGDVIITHEKDGTEPNNARHNATISNKCR